MFLTIVHYLHVLSGIVWAGGSILFGLVVLPALVRSGGPAAAATWPSLSRLAGPVMGSAGGLVMLTGIVRAVAGGRITGWGDLWSGYAFWVLVAFLLIGAAEASGGPTRRKIGALTADMTAFNREAPAVVRRDALIHLFVVLAVTGIMVGFGFGWI
ncbi:hypothetical protein [Pelagovum pacificum]|uniref:Copper resistance protein D domain-containing protein n=1 Tax=Pelagovum pacificum TaxID=2588711 RepID=A0A5C5GG37_9RHOB|nr:hypothetical protein [Pelagovum pacificum]QQA43682.1 hypothetical protein I8N54_03645 [Pelagovum pacificum]TNY33184.1 hypothetical protein FHY64_07885 [Pelagovum pacificum]